MPCLRGFSSYAKYHAVFSRMHQTPDLGSGLVSPNALLGPNLMLPLHSFMAAASTCLEHTASGPCARQVCSYAHELVVCSFFCLVLWRMHENLQDLQTSLSLRHMLLIPDLVRPVAGSASHFAANGAHLTCM